MNMSYSGNIWYLFPDSIVLISVTHLAMVWNKEKKLKLGACQSCSVVLDAISTV